MAEVKSGFMHKCGNTVRSWKRRWFVLKPNGYLYYYENSKSKSEKGKVDVIDAQRVAPWQEVSTAERKLPSGFSSLNAFAIVTSERTYTCVCENEGDSEAWIKAIQKVREGAGTSDEQYPPPTYPKEEEAVQVKREEYLESAPPPKPPPYTPSAAAAAPPQVAKMPSPLDYGGNLPYQQPQPQGYNTLPKPQAPPQQPVPPQGYNTLPKPAAQQRSASFTGAPPPGGPGYAGGYPVGNYQQPPPAAAYPPRPPPAQYQQPYQQPPQPQYRPPPQPQYRPPPQPQYQPQYRPPPQPQYRPAPQPQYRPAPQPQYRPMPQPQYSYRPPPPQPQYRPPPPQPAYRVPYQSYPRPPPVKKTTVTVVTVPAATTQYIVRR